eukprot:1744839-Prymnesium_polylepis.1
MRQLRASERERGRERANGEACACCYFGTRGGRPLERQQCGGRHQPDSSFGRVAAPAGRARSRTHLVHDDRRARGQVRLRRVKLAARLGLEEGAELGARAEGVVRERRLQEVAQPIRASLQELAALILDDLLRRQLGHERLAVRAAEGHVERVEVAVAAAHAEGGRADPHLDYVERDRRLARHT